MKKSPIIILVIILLAAIGFSVDFSPQGNINGRGSFNIFNFSQINASEIYLNGTLVSTNVNSILNWTGLQNYPSPCPDGSAVTTLNDSVTCTSFLLSSGGNISGDVDISGNITANNIYGFITYYNETTAGYPVVINTQNVWVNITGFNVPGSTQELNGFLFDSQNNSLICLESGMYDASFALSFSNGGVNNEYEVALARNGSPLVGIEAHMKISSNGDVGSASVRGIINCSFGDQITLQTRNVDGSSNIGIHHAGITMSRLGS